MKRVQLVIGYSESGQFDLENLSDEVFGAVTRAALNQATNPDSTSFKYQDVTWKPILEKDPDAGDDIPF